MADLKDLLKGRDAEEIEDIREAIDNFAKSYKDLKDEQLLISQNAAKALLESKNTIEALLEDNGRALNKLITDTSKLGTKAANERVKELKEIRAHVKANQTAFTQTVEKYNKDSGKLTKAIDTTAKSTNTMSRRMLELAKDAKATGKESKDLSLSFDDLGDAAVGVAKASAGLIAGLRGETLAMMALMSGISFRAVRDRIKAMITELDVDFRGVIQRGTADTEKLNQSFVSAIDPIYAVRQGFVSVGKAGKMLTNVGITSKDAAAALESLKNNAMSFRDTLEDADPGITAFTVNLVAGMKKIGITTEHSTKAIDTFTKSLKTTPMAATKSVKRLIKIADSLDINVGKAFADFNSNINTFVQFGGRAVEVFAGIEKQALATGISVGNLAKTAEKLDTFKGAATAAQGLNAILGDTYLSMTDLVHAEPEEKFNLIRDAMRQAGIDFQSSNRFFKKSIASVIGVDVDFASRLFGSEEDFAAASERLKTGTMDTEEMTKRVEGSLTIAQTMQKSLSSLVGGMSKIVNKGRVVAKDLADQIGGAFSTIRKEVGGSGKALVAFMAAMEGVAAVTGLKKKAKIAAMGVGAAGAAVVLAAAQIKKVPVVGPGLFYALEKAMGKDLDDPPDGHIGEPPAKTTKATAAPAGGTGTRTAATKFTRDRDEGTGDLGKSVQILAAAVERQAAEGTPVQIILVAPEDLQTAEMKYEGAINAFNGKLVKAFSHT